jgi:hypothetical protein
VEKKKILQEQEKDRRQKFKQLTVSVQPDFQEVVSEPLTSPMSTQQYNTHISIAPLVSSPSFPDLRNSLPSSCRQ